MWNIEVTDRFREWYEGLDGEQQALVIAAVERLERDGPALGRPTVGEIVGSAIHNLKELRPAGSSIRILFVFDPRRTAILLLAGDKADHGWSAWYTTAVSEAERLYDEYLAELREEELIE